MSVNEPRSGGGLPRLTEWDAYWAMRAPLDRAVRCLQRGELDDLDVVLDFLTERPRFHGSGYLAERALIFLGRAELTADQGARVTAIATAIIEAGISREAGRARRLLARLSERAEAGGGRP